MEIVFGPAEPTAMMLSFFFRFKYNYEMFTIWKS